MNYREQSRLGEVRAGNVVLCTLSGEYSADDAWEFSELEEAITKEYM